MVTKGGCPGWFKQRTNLEKTLISLSSLLMLTLVLIILVGITFHGSDSESKEDKDKYVCWSKDCISTAGQMFPMMDEKADPCTNFYDYSCGRYGGKPGQTSSVSQSSIDAVYLFIRDLMESSSKIDVPNFDTVKSLYKTCTEFNGLHRERKESAYILLELMDRFGVGNWPVVSTIYEDSDLSISDRLASLAMVGVPVAFKIEVVPDPQVSGSYLMKLSPGGPLEKGRPALDIRKDNDLRTYMLFSLLLLGAPTYLRAQTAVDDILSVDAYYATVEQDPESICDTIDTLAPEESMYQLNNLMPEMNWTSLLVRIQREAGLKRPFAVELHCKSKIRDYLVHLNDVTIRTSYNYLGWRFFESFSKHIGPAFGQPQSDVDNGTPRWRQCVKLLERYAGPLLARALTMHYVKEGTGEKVQKIGATVQSVAEKLVSQTRWLNQQQKSRIFRQTKSIYSSVSSAGLPTNGSHNLRLPAVRRENYTAVVINLRRQRIIQELKQLDPMARSSHTSVPWEMYLTSDMSFTTKPSVIYFDKIREPYLRLQGPDWMNYGAYGNFMARELSKNLLVEGIEPSLDLQISLWDFWFNDRNASSCLFNLFLDKFGANMMDSNESVLKELFLDASALEIAFETAKSGAKSGDSLPGMEQHSDEQMFFIAYAQTLCEVKRSVNDTSHIPIKDRVNAMVTNSKAFEKAFSCSFAAANRCQVWS